MRQPGEDATTHPVPTSSETQPRSESQVAELEARIADLERQLASEREAATDYMHRWQRTAADFSNFKRRVQQEQEQLRGLAAAEALTPVLHALDSFERAFATLPASLRTYSWVDGIALIDLQLRRVLDIHGITPVEAEPGGTFDPARHQAVGEVESSAHPAGAIAEVLQRGYEMHGILLRPALVQLARTPSPATEEAPATAAEAPEASGERDASAAEPSG